MDGRARHWGVKSLLPATTKVDVGRRGECGHDETTEIAKEHVEILSKLYNFWNTRSDGYVGVRPEYASGVEDGTKVEDEMLRIDPRKVNTRKLLNLL